MEAENFNESKSLQQGDVNRNSRNLLLAPVLLFVCFIIGHKIVNRKCVRCETKFGVPRMENCPPPPKKKGITFKPPVITLLPDFELQFCKRCYQMTNHLDNKCQKCKGNIL